MRTWRAGDPEPDDRPDVVDNEGDIWVWEAPDPEAIAGCLGALGSEHGGWWSPSAPSMGGLDLWDWEKIFTDGVDELREATPEESAEVS